MKMLAFGQQTLAED